MKRPTIRLTAVMMLAALLLTMFAIPAFAEGEETADTRSLIIISDMGIHDTYPENSQPALQAAIHAGADMLRLPIRKTADGVLILAEDDDLSRICDTDHTPINALSYADIQQLRVKEGAGGNTAETEYTVPLLTDTLETFGERTLYLLDFDFAIRDDVYQAVRETGLLGKCLFVLRASADKALAWKNSFGNSLLNIVVYQKTNVIFKALSTEKKLLKDNGAYVWFAASNPYGVVFGKTVAKRFSALSGAMARISRKDLSGKRLDTPDYWENLVQAGYNMFITDDVARLAEYREQSLLARRDLLVTMAYVADSFTLPEFKSSTFRKLKFAYTNADTQAQRLANKAFAGKNECEDARYNLKAAVNDIRANYAALEAGKADFSVTPGKIITAVLTVGLFVLLQVFILKKRKKSGHQ
ncbi:MAG: glycerophosphodiester phosphodiesterase family protein [Clostridia bacterium]|nr:glycerophosphodiester phosphodiesterase family protein [Clostridia bacterium]